MTSPRVAKEDLCYAAKRILVKSNVLVKSNGMIHQAHIAMPMAAMIQLRSY